MVTDEALSRFVGAIESARATPFDSRRGQPNPNSYYGPLLAADEATRAATIRKQLAYLRDIFGFARLTPHGLDVLEAGSGFGLGLLALACMGARTALGVEIVAQQVAWARRCASTLDELGSRIRVEVGTVNEMPFDSESVDVVLSLEAISHYLDHRPFLAEAWRVLRPGGVLIISDTNNGLNPLIRSRTRRLWALHETVPGEKGRSQSDYPFHFVDKRQAIIAEAYPKLPGETALRLALLTSGMVRGQVIEAARRYVDEGLLPNQPYRPGQLTVHPTGEMVMERLFNPFRLAAEIRGYGFRTRMRGHWAGATKRRSLRIANRALAAVTPISIVTARAFRIAAVKPTRPRAALADRASGS